MSAYLVALLALVILCGLWAVFQQWLRRHDPDAEARSLNCGACERQSDCGGESGRP